MRHLFTLSLCLFIAFGIKAQVPKPPAPHGPVITFDQIVHDYGDIHGEVKDGNWDFRYENKGDQPLIVSNCQTSSGCLVANWDHEPLAPGKSASVKVKYDTQRVGPFQKTITVLSNAMNTPVAYLRIMGKVLPDPSDAMRVVPDSLLLAPAPKVSP